MAIRWIFGDVMPYDIVGNVPVIFVHIPKNAGTSIKEYFNLEPSCHSTMQEMYDFYHHNGGMIGFYHDEEIEGRSFEEIMKKGKKLSGILKVLMGGGLFRTPWEPSFKFSIVRNPWDRISSIYHYHKKDFSEFKNFKCLLRALGTKSRPFDKGVLSHTQTDFLSVGGKIELNFLGKYENLKKDVESLYQHLTDEEKKEFDIFEKRSNNSKNCYTEMYEDFDSIYTVFRCYYDDVVNFKYTFSNMENCEQTSKCFERYKKEVSCIN